MLFVETCWQVHGLVSCHMLDLKRFALALETGLLVKTKVVCRHGFDLLYFGTSSTAQGGGGSFKDRTL